MLRKVYKATISNTPKQSTSREGLVAIGDFLAAFLGALIPTYLLVTLGNTMLARWMNDSLAGILSCCAALGVAELAIPRPAEVSFRVAVGCAALVWLVRNSLLIQKGTQLPIWGKRKRLELRRWRTHVTLPRPHILLLWLGMTAFALVGVFPPQVAYFYIRGHAHPPHLGHRVIGDPTTAGIVDIRQLAVEWTIIAVVTAAAVFTFRPNRSTSARGD